MFPHPNFGWVNKKKEKHENKECNYMESQRSRRF